MNILLEAHSDEDFGGGYVADYLSLILDETALQRLRDLVAAAKMFGEQFGDEWVVNSVKFSLTSALPTAIFCWLKYDPFYGLGGGVEEAFRDKGWAIIPDDFSLPTETEDGEDLVVITELDFFSVWTRDGDIRFLANPNNVDIEMWAGDLNLDQLMEA